MTNNSSPFDLTIQRCGPIAAQALAISGPGEVVAVFENSFYLRHQNIFLCIGGSDFTEGPLNVVSSAADGTNWKACGLKVETKSFTHNNQLRIGPQFKFDLSHAGLWHPCQATEMASSLEVLEVVSRYFESNGPTDGLAPVVFGAAEPPLVHARHLIENMSVWLHNSLQQNGPSVAVPAVKDILGLGPGLTPSGDDFIGAMMITLHTCKELNSLNALCAAVNTHTTTHTNPISAQHLSAASQGLGSAAFHNVLLALCTEDNKRLIRSLNKLTSIGHTSGWDALAGLYTTLKVWHDARRSRPIAA